MKTISITSIIFLSILFVGCDNKQNSFLPSDKVVYLTEDNIPPLQKILFEKIDISEDLSYASSFYVYRDTLLVLAHNIPNPYWLTFMNMKGDSVIAQYLKKGNGPNDMLCNFTNMHNNRLLYDGCVTNKLTIFNLDSVLRKGQSYMPQIHWLSNSRYVSFDMLTDTSFVFYNYWYLENGGEKINKGVPELVVTGKDANYSYEPPHNVTVVNIVSGANVLSDINRKRVFVAHHCKPQFTLLNSDLDTLKIICGPEPIEKYKYEDKGDFGGLWPILYNEYTLRSITSDNYIFVWNRRIHNIKREDIDEYRDNHKPEIFKFDWDGNLLARYQDINIDVLHELSGFSEESNTLYLTAWGENNERTFYKAKLPM